MAEQALEKIVPASEQPTQSGSVLAMLERIAKDPTIDAQKAGAFLDLQIRMMDKQAELAFNDALSEMEPRLSSVPKTKQGHNSKYAPNEEIDRMIRPLLRESGFSLSFSIDEVNGKSMFVGTLTHKQGHSRRAMIPFVSDKGGSKNDNQAIASATSYNRRYTTMMLLNIVTVDEDDDAQSAEPISEQDAIEIEAMIKGSGADEKLFLSKVMKAESVRAIQRRDLDKAKAQLRKKFASQKTEATQ